MQSERLLSAYSSAREQLLSKRVSAGHWVGRLSSSPLSTATAVSALALVERHSPTDAVSGRYQDEGRESHLCALIVDGLNWLADHQNADGGWGDTELSHSNIATTMLAVAAFHMTGVPADHADLLDRARAYMEAQGRISGLRKRYGRDRTFAAPILASSALAGLVSWREVTPLPFELACLPQKFFRFLRLPVVSYAVPALVAIGQARHRHSRSVNPLLAWLRDAAVNKSLEVIRQMQPVSGGYLEAIPLTSFVLMMLADDGRVQHPVVQRGVQFLLDSVRSDGSWPIDTNLATWNTTLAINALAQGGEDVAPLGCLDWLLSCQHRQRHPFTGAAPGGWGWSDLSGAVPDADDTAGALLALGHWYQSASCSPDDQRRIRRAASEGLRWLLKLQNRDGGWPTFCRGWTRLPFDRSGADLTAHALRAFHLWQQLAERAAVEAWHDGRDAEAQYVVTEADVHRATNRGLAYLRHQQRPDGSWVPLWFGNQDHEGEENPIYGTARVLRALAQLGQLKGEPARRGIDFLRKAQNPDGGWGSAAPRSPDIVSSVEETALAVDALLPLWDNASMQPAIERGLDWLMRAVEEGRDQQCAPIGFYFAKLWYYEELYPHSFTVSALGHAVARMLRRPAGQPTTADLPHA